MFSLNIEKVTNSMKQDKSTYVEDKKILLQISQTENDMGIQKKGMSISIYIDKIIVDISITTNNSNNDTNFTKDVSKEMKCTDKIRYMILMKVMHCLVKVCKKKGYEVSKDKNKK